MENCAVVFVPYTVFITVKSDSNQSSSIKLKYSNVSKNELNANTGFENTRIIKISFADKSQATEFEVNVQTIYDI